MPPEAVGKYLLDWHQAASAELRQHYLEGVMQDLAEHQLGLLAGVREAVENVVAKVSPARVMAMAKDERGWSLAEKIEAGAVGVNVNDTSELHAPFGGWKMSGMGRELGPEGLHAFLEKKHIKLRLRSR